MNSTIVIVALVQFMLVCSPLTIHSAALNRDTDSNQLWSIDRELFQACLKESSLRVKNHRTAMPRDRVRMYAGLQQGDLLQELLTTEVIRHGSTQIGGEAKKSLKYSHENNRQESWLLKEFTAETSITMKKTVCNVPADAGFSGEATTCPF